MATHPHSDHTNTELELCKESSGIGIMNGMIFRYLSATLIFPLTLSVASSQAKHDESFKNSHGNASTMGSYEDVFGLLEDSSQINEPCYERTMVCYGSVKLSPLFRKPLPKIPTD